MVLPLERLGLGPPPVELSLEEVQPGTYCARWKCPPTRFASRFLLGVCPLEPGLEEDPRKVNAYIKLEVVRKDLEAGGGGRPFLAEPEWAGACVCVWACVDLGLQLLYSPPLVLGLLEPARKRGLARILEVIKEAILGT